MEVVTAEYYAVTCLDDLEKMTKLLVRIVSLQATN
jgi:hypothetical protein